MQEKALFSPASKTDKAVRRLNMTAVCTSESMGAMVSTVKAAVKL